MVIREDGLMHENIVQPPAASREDLAGAAGPPAGRRSILFVIGTLDLGGTESQLVLLARELKRRGWKVEVFVLSRGGVLAEQLTQAGIVVFYGHHRPTPAPVEAVDEPP